MSDGIDLKNLKSAHMTKAFELDLIAMDVDGNDQLDAGDLTAVYGKTAVEAHFNDLVRAVKTRQHSLFKSSITAMASMRIYSSATDKIGQLFEDKASLAMLKGKITTTCGPTNEVTNNNLECFVKAKESAVLLIEPLFQALQSEGVMTDRDAAFQILLRALRGEIKGFEKEYYSLAQMGAVMFCEYGFRYLDTRFLPSRYDAELRYYEYRQTQKLSKIERDYNINLLINKHALSQPENKMLRVVFDFFRQSRPDDFSLLKTLAIREEHWHIGNGSVPLREEGRINVVGIFGKVKSDSKVYRGDEYAIETSEPDTKMKAVDRFKLLFAHELGHLVAKRDGEVVKDSGHYYLRLPSGYSVLVEDSRFGNEWFAEDYGIYLVSGGKKVMSKTAKGRVVPNYDLRLQYMRDHYPIVKP